ncbi:MAG: hypothetical protein IJW63_03475 [Lachnospiraceae bacterium]|nr:hypothetical protein [Lachnospiraceae bacterium]
MSKIRKYVDLSLSILFITSVILGYYKDISHMTEYCFVSGILVGIIFFISFIWQQRRETSLPACVYLACLVDIFVIFIATIVIGLNLEGAFWFIHIINPIAILFYWFLFCDERSMDWKGTLSVVAYPLLYMSFAFILFKTSGKCPFPASLIFMDYRGIVPLLILIVLAIILWGLGYILHMLNNLVRGNR